MVRSVDKIQLSGREDVERISLVEVRISKEERERQSSSKKKGREEGVKVFLDHLLLCSLQYHAFRDLQTSSMILHPFPIVLKCD